MKIKLLFTSLATLTVLIVFASCNKPAMAGVELKYDNNSLREYLPVSAPTFTGYLVSFNAPSNKFTINKIRINGMVAAWGEYRDKSIDVQIWDKDKNVLYQDSYPDTQLPVNPYDDKTAFRPENAWTDITVPGIIVTGLFYVHIHSDDGRWGEFRMGADDSVINSHSDLTVRDNNADIILEGWPYWKKDAAGHDLWYGDKTKVNWMIRMVGENSN
ncbi:MAG: hypothetical protein ACYDHZ_01810 [Dehalococcoidia bacterium]